jgi:hypothetical protein
MSISSLITRLPHRIFWLADEVLRGRVETLAANRPVLLNIAILCLMLVCGLGYGAVMGSYAESISAIRPWQVLYSATKVPFLLLATFALSLPSFYVANTMLGLHADFGRALRALLSAQSALTLVLAGLAPFTLFWYGCGATYGQALAFNSLMFGLSSLSVQVLLKRLYRPLIERDSRHAWMVRVWLVIYTFIGIQMGWVLRPFIGSPKLGTAFFREEAWGNAYLEIFDLFYRSFFVG